MTRGKLGIKVNTEMKNIYLQSDGVDRDSGGESGQPR